MNSLRVVFVLCEQMLATSVSLPLEQLKSADMLAQARKSPSGAYTHKLQISLVSIDGEPVETHTGLTLQPDSAFSAVNEADIVYLPALWRNPRPILKKNQALLPWLQHLYESGSLIAGVGTGCCFLAEAGLLDNKPATTHWHYFDEFQKQYPQVALKRQYFITQAGSLYCTGSVNALADLTIHFIQRYYSRLIASHVERHFFHEIRSAYDNTKALQEINHAHPDEEIIQTQIWLQDNYAREISLQELAEQFGMSTRTFNRRFKNATGATPLAYLQKIRMESAKDLLQTTNLTIGDIIYKVGYQDPVHFASLFKKHHGVTPSQYRTTVRAKLFSL